MLFAPSLRATPATGLSNGSTPVVAYGNPLTGCNKTPCHSRTMSDLQRLERPCNETFIDWENQPWLSNFS